MRRNWKRVLKYGLLVWLLAMLAVTAVSVLQIYEGNKDLVSIAEDDLRYYQEHGVLSPSVAEYGANNYVYGPDGERLAFHSSYGADQLFDFDGYARKLLPRLTGDKAVFRLEYSFSLTRHIAAAVAIPTEDGGLFLFLRELDSADRTLTALYVSVTGLALLVILYLSLILRKTQAMEQQQREYIDNVHHELKSPIAAVKALAEPIHDGLVGDPETLQRYSAIMLRELSSLERTVSDMLELSRLQTGGAAIRAEALTARAAFGEVLAKYAVLCDEFGLSFAAEEPEPSPMLRTNAALASRLLEILLNNAFKFTEANGNIRVSFASLPGRLTVTVQNDGPQIAPEDQKHIFERFYQGGKGHEKQGSGLGLAIAKEIADRLGERLWLERSLPGDTAFSFTVKKEK